MYYRDRRTAVGLTDFAPPWPLVSVTATLAAFRVLDKWNEPDKREKDGATINFFEYLEVVHGAQVPSRGSRAPVVSRSSASGGGILRCPSKDKGSGMPQPRRARMVRSPSLGDLRAYDQDKQHGQQDEPGQADDQHYQLAGGDHDRGGFRDHGGVTARSRRITFCIGAEEKDWSNFARSHFPKEFSRSQSPQHSSPLQSPGRASPSPPGSSPVQQRSAWHDVTPEARQQSHACDSKAQGESGAAAACGHELAHRDADPCHVEEDVEGGDSPFPHQRRLSPPRRGILPFHNNADYLCDTEPRGAVGFSSSSEPSLAAIAILRDATPAAAAGGQASASAASSSPQGSACAGRSGGAPAGAAEASFSPAWPKQVATQELDATQELVQQHVLHHGAAHSTPPPAPPADAEDPPDIDVISLEAAQQLPLDRAVSEPEVVAGKLEVQV